MKYAEMILLQNNICRYLSECYSDVNCTKPIEEGDDVSKDIDKMFNHKNKYQQIYVFDASEQHIRKLSDDVKADKNGYEFAKLINKLSASITSIGTGTAMIGKLFDSNTAVLLGTAVAISGILSCFRFSNKYVEKQGDNYVKKLSSLKYDLDLLKEDLENADDDIMDYIHKFGKTEKGINVKASRNKAYRDIEEIQRNIDRIIYKITGNIDDEL